MQKLKKWTLYSLIGISAAAAALTIFWFFEWKPLSEEYGLPALIYLIPISILGPILVYILTPFLLQALDKLTPPIIRFLEKK